jgi:hypothetical protein
MEIDGMTGCEKLIQIANALWELLSKVDGIEIAHRNTPEQDATGPIVRFQRFPHHADRAHIIVAL